MIFGGSFDPTHAGHKALLAAAAREIKPDITHVFPAYQSPFKERSATPFELRMKMAENAFKNIPARLIFDNFEYKCQKKTFAHELIEHVQKIYDRPEIFMLVGTDALNEIPAWKNPDLILKNATIVSGRRGGAARGKPPLKYYALKTPMPEISSSQIRLQIMLAGKAGAEAGPSANIINKHRLYYLNLHDWLKKNLKKERYEHTLAVAEMSVKLAKANGADPERAALAALLHDSGKSMDGKALAAYAKKHSIKPPFYNLICVNAPELLHSYVSARMAQKLFGVSDKIILNAVERHTLGALGMGLYDKILYVADIASKDRKYKGAAALRALAFKNLDAAMLAAARVKLVFTADAGKWLCPQGYIVWNHLLKKF